MANEIAQYGGLEFFNTRLESEPKVKWVIGFGWLARSFRGPMEMIERYHSFNVQ